MELERSGAGTESHSEFISPEKNSVDCIAQTELLVKCFNSYLIFYDI